MALVNNGVKVSIPDAQLAASYTRPTVTEFTDYEFVMSNKEITIAKSGVENATPATTLTALIAAVSTAIGVFITAEFDVTLYTVTVWSDCKIIRQNQNADEVLWTDGTNNYLCTCDIYIKNVII